VRHLLWLHPEYRTACFDARAAYAELLEARSCLRPAADPASEVARVLGVSSERAASLLAAVREAGLVSAEGLTLLVGVGPSSRAAGSSALEGDEDGRADLDGLRAALRAYSGSRRELARSLGCSEGLLRAFGAGRKPLGSVLAGALAERLGVDKTADCVPTAYPLRTQSGTHEVRTEVRSPSPLSDSPLSSPSLTDSLNFPSEKREEKSNVAGEGGGPGEGVRTQCVPTAYPEGTHLGTQSGTQQGTQSEVRTGRAPRRPRPTPAVDTIPLDGTVARRVYDAITTDGALAPITRGPGDLAQRLAAICDGTSVDPVAEVISAGAWLTRNPGRWRDGASGLLRWVKASADRARAVPAPVVGIARPAAQTARIDYKGNRVVGPAGLPPGSVWDRTRAEHEAEEDAIYREAYEATQPRRRQ